MIRLQGNGMLYTVSLLTCLGFFLIGYDNGLMGGLVNTAHFDSTFHIDTDSRAGTDAIALIVAIYEIGCFCGAVATSIYGERIGRRRTVFVGVVVMIVGALLQATAYTRAHMIIARIVSGVGMGAINSTVPVIMAEFAPKATRGIFVCAQLSCLNFGIMLVYWIDYAFTRVPGAHSYVWRVPVILQCIFLLPMLLLITILPETPRWLIAHNRSDEALDVLRRLNNAKVPDEDIVQIHADILRTVQYESSIGAGSWSELLGRKDDSIQSRKRLLIACSVQAFQQLGGINVLIYFSNTLFQKSLNFNDNLAALMSGILNTWFFAASFIPWLLIDRIGRRPLFLSMISLMAAVMAVQTGLVWKVEQEIATSETTGTTLSPSGYGIGAAAMLFIFQGAFTIGFQATVWVYPSEILPLKLRQRGSAISTACNWIFNFMIVYITPPAIKNIGYRTYIIFAVLNATWAPIIYFVYPETKGLALEDVDRLFARTDEAQRYMSVDAAFPKCEDVEQVADVSVVKHA